MVLAVEKVRERLLRATAALSNARVEYAVAGGNAVAAWVATVDPGAVRNTQDVDILLRRADLQSAVTALEASGFIYRHATGIDMFLDGPDAGARDAVHLVPANEKIRPDYTETSPDVTDSRPTDQFRLLELEPLVKMKLTSYRRKDQVHLLDLLGVGLIDASWPARFSPELATKLQQLMDTPDE
jgi:hypothetical protein